MSLASWVQVALAQLASATCPSLPNALMEIGVLLPAVRRHAEQHLWHHCRLVKALNVGAVGVVVAGASCGLALPAHRRLPHPPMKDALLLPAV